MEEEKSFIKHRPKDEGAEITFSFDPPLDRGISKEEIWAICQSIYDAKQAMKKEDLDDLIHGFATVKEDSDQPHQAHPSIRLRLLDQIEQAGGPSRFAYAKKTAKPIRENEWIRELWILRNWLSFQDETVCRKITEIGLCDLEDELAALIIHDRFNCREFSKKTFRRFRGKYKLRQVPQIFKLRGIRKSTKGCAHYEITAIGGRSA